MLQVRDGRPRRACCAVLARHGVPRRCVIGAPRRDGRGARSPAAAARCSTRAAHRAAARSGPRPPAACRRLRDNPECAPRGVRPHPRRGRPRPACRTLTFDPARGRAPRPTSPAARGRAMAILREQGVNGQVEMAAAFDRAGFEADRRPHDRHHRRPRLASRLQGPGRLRRLLLRRRAGRAARAGPRASSSTRARATSSRPSSRRADTFALGVCNGCQMMSNLHEIIPGAEHWPRFVQEPLGAVRGALRHWSRCPRARRCFFAGMAGSRMPIAIAHGEGRAVFADAARRAGRGAGGAALRRQPRRARPRRYPANPNGSPAGITGVTTADGRFTDPHAAPGARVPHRAAVLAPRRLGRGQPLDAHVPQRARTGRLAPVIPRSFAWPGDEESATPADPSG